MFGTLTNAERGFGTMQLDEVGAEDRSKLGKLLNGHLEGVLQKLGIIATADTEVREMIEETTEHFFAMECVEARVEDVVVPHFIDFLRWNRGCGKCQRHEEEGLVLSFHQECLLERPIALVNEFENDWLKIHGTDLLSKLTLLDVKPSSGCSLIHERFIPIKNSEIISNLVETLSYNYILSIAVNYIITS